MNYDVCEKFRTYELKGERGLTNQKRFCVAMTPELEEKIVDLRKTDKYCRKSLSEIVRILIQKGLEAENQPA